MTEYIEREAAIRAVKGRFSMPVDNLIVKVIGDVPATDVEPVRHGAWEYDPNAMDYNLGGWVCSLCGMRNNNIGSMPGIPPLRFAGSSYCPNCGARMQEAKP